ncbi:MAG: hypothetical protein J0I29_10105 [Rhizobiales bacterium]|nr:hypothetical protein [Hyphomicrobiales bacterium]
MSKLLEKLIAKVRKLPDDEQDLVAGRLMAHFDEVPSDADRVSIEEAREAYENGDFAVLAKWKHDMGIGDN